MSLHNEWVRQSPERERLYAEEKLIVDVAEEIWAAMERAGRSKAEVAEALDKSKAYVSQVLNGSRNMTLRTLADISHVLHCKAVINLQDVKAVEQWQSVGEATCVQLRKSVLLSGVMNAGNHDVWQNFEGCEIAKPAIRVA